MAEFTEGIVRYMAAALADGTTGVNAQITAINTAYNDGITVPQNLVVYEGRRFSIGHKLPCCVIWPESMSAVEPTNGLTIDATHTMMVWSVVSSKLTEKNLSKILWRHMLAVYRAIRATHNLDGEIDICKFAGWTFDSPWASVDEKIYLEIGGGIYTIQDEEEV